MEKKILPIVVIYRCQLSASVAYQSLILRNGIQEFVVYDNSPSDYQQEEGMIPSGAIYFHDGENGGLSKAYNYGARIARELGYGHVLLLDQDTEFAADAFEVYLSSLHHQVMLVPNVMLAHQQPFSPVHPTWCGTDPVHLDEGLYPLEHYRAINSGCCVPVDLYWKAGGYNEEVRLDFSDFEFQRRLAKVCDSFYVLPTVALQDFSNDEQDCAKLYRRFSFYLDGAKHCVISGFKARSQHAIMVLKHTVALSLRTKKVKFIVLYLKKYLFHR